MNEWLKLTTIGVCLLATWLCEVETRGHDYNQTMLIKAVADHSLILIAEVDRVDGDHAVIKTLEPIKGQPEMSYRLPRVWRPGMEFAFVPIELVEGQKYYLMLQRNEEGEVSLSRDYASDGVVLIESNSDPIARAARVVHQYLSLEDDPEARQRMLEKAFEEESDETIYRMLREFLTSPADEATVSFLVQSMSVPSDRSNLKELSSLVLQAHLYQSAIPGLLDTLDQHDWACIYPAMALGKLRAEDAYEPIMKLIDDDSVGNRQYFIHALCHLADERSTSFLTETLESYRDNNTYVHYSWSDPLTSALDIEDRQLQLLVIERLGLIGALAYQSAPKIQSLIWENETDEEYLQVARLALERIGN